MDFTGLLKNLQYDYYSRKALVTLEIDQEPSVIEELKDCKLSIKLSKYRARRSLDSNAYFHVLCDKLRQKLNISMAECKNNLITSYGQIEYIEPGKAFIYKTNAKPEWMCQQEYIHMELIKIGEDGAYWYRAYRGSHTYDTEEMSKLIKGTVEEAVAQGIEVATPDEIAHMQQLWKARYENGKGRMD